MALKKLDAVSVEIKVAGKACDYVTMALSQSVSAHHRFKIKVNYRPDKPSVWAIGPDVIFKQLGEKVSIIMTHHESGEKTVFYGLISDIRVEGFDGDQGYVILEGGSPTILMDRDPAMDCYVEQNLNTIVSDILDKSGVKMNVGNNPRHTDIIPYVARYKETGYGFLSRLLRSYGEWFYYNGETLQIGDPEIETETRAGYDVDLTGVSINATVRSLNHSTYEFNPVDDQFYYDYSGRPKGATLGSRSAEKCSDPIFPTEARLPSIRSAYSAMDLEHYGDAVMPVAYPEMARVVSNDDPKNQGRVKVQFMWQEIDGGESYWMRVQSPDAGRSDQVSRNRGFLFIPEPGDLVMVGFEQGNPDRPYVTGSIFYKANSEGAATDNTVKSIRTRSGHTLEFNDDEGGNWGITIKDRNGCIFHFDTKEKEILISAPQKITIDAKDIVISANNQINMVADKAISVNGRENISFVTKAMQTDIENGCVLNAKELTGIAEKTEIQSTKENLVLSSGKEVINKSKSKKIRLS